MEVMVAVAANSTAKATTATEAEVGENLEVVLEETEATGVVEREEGALAAEVEEALEEEEVGSEPVREEVVAVAATAQANEFSPTIRFMSLGCPKI